MANINAPIEMIDAYLWENRRKIITRDVHGVSGLMNFTHFRHLASEPSTPVHYHTNIIEILCIVKGRRTNRIYSNGSVEEHVYTGGEAFIVFPGELHATGNDTQQDPCEVLAVQLNISEADDFLGLNPHRGRELCARLTALKNRHLRMNSEDLSLMRHAFELFSTQDEQDRDEGLMHLVCFLYRFLKMPAIAPALHTSSNPRIQQAIDYIEQNITEPLQLNTLAALTGYSLSRFKTIFREETGETPAAYITACKIERAKELLLHTSQSITDIAYNLGWSSSNYFCSVFRKLTGMNPLQFRKYNRDNEL